MTCPCSYSASCGAHLLHQELSVRRVDDREAANDSSEI